MITSVDIVGDDTVQITCQEDMTGLQVVVGYAATAEGGDAARGPTGRLGPAAQLGSVRRNVHGERRSRTTASPSS